MRPDDQQVKDTTVATTRKNLIAKDTIPTPNPASKYDDQSIQILAKALARLKQPKYESDDTTGDYLGTEYNESGEDDQKTEDMEQLISKALLRLKLDQSVASSSRPVLKTDIHGLVRNAPADDIDSLNPSVQKTRNDLLRKEAIRTVEDRLVQDVALINKLGMTVEEVMQDLKEKLKREQKLSQIEGELDKLAQQRLD
ncbi:unnamed protein product [Lymnaea stagnalis]|uniref:Uncharacterized protein n=1 Tax=Lymnaea stagnalis TaxID=6523 RepID=A0AAV2HVJ2_LYMST